MTKITKTTLLGYEAVAMEAGGYQALLVPAQGANLVRLYNKEKNIDILRTPTDQNQEDFATRPQIFGLPLLFPPNRIEDGKYTYKGKTYQFPITLPAQNNYHHGILKSQKFTVTKTEIGKDYVEVEASFWSNFANDQIYCDFAHAFECRMNFKLSSRGLIHTVTFINQSDSEMPLGVGYHTPFKVPFSSNGKSQDYLLQLSVGKRWEVDERTLPTGNLVSLTDEEKLLREAGAKPTGIVWDTPFTAEPITIDGKPYHGAVITDTATGKRVFYEVDSQYKHWTLWNNGGQLDWVCAEPQTWAINAPNIDMPAEVTGFQALAPGKSWSAVSKIYVK